jgi:hypothetical protein
MGVEIMANKLPKKSNAWNFRKLKFEITNEAIYDLIALHITVYDHSFKQALRYAFMNYKMAQNLHAINQQKFDDLVTKVNAKIEEYEKLSRNKRKEALRRIITEVGR